MADTTTKPLVSILFLEDIQGINKSISYKLRKLNNKQVTVYSYQTYEDAEKKLEKLNYKIDIFIADIVIHNNNHLHNYGELGYVLMEKFRVKNTSSLLIAYTKQPEELYEARLKRINAILIPKYGNLDNLLDFIEDYILNNN